MSKKNFKKLKSEFLKAVEAEDLNETIIILRTIATTAFPYSQKMEAQRAPNIIKLPIESDSDVAKALKLKNAHKFQGALGLTRFIFKDEPWPSQKAETLVF